MLWGIFKCHQQFLANLEEVNYIFDKYFKSPFDSTIVAEDEFNKLVFLYSKDLAVLTDLLCRIIDKETYPDYYSLNEGTIVGLITRIIKLYKELINKYQQNEGEILTIFVRLIYESFITLKYLIKNGHQSQKNFRIISYKSRYENYKLLCKEPDQNHPIIKRQLIKLKNKLKVDGFTIADLETENQKKGRWKLDGKSFRKIHSEVDLTQLYSFIYGAGF